LDEIKVEIFVSDTIKLITGSKVQNATAVGKVICPPFQMSKHE
jgi:hypothetical protein